MRDPLDRYYTPQPAIDALLQHAPEIGGGGLLVDPSSGDGRMVRSLLDAARFSCAFTNDLDSDVQADAHEDAAVAPSWESWPLPDWVVTNPPWRASSQIARHALRRARFGVALLVRCTFLEPVKKRTWLSELPPSRILCLPRLCFAGRRTDSAPAWWLVWSKCAAVASGAPIVVVLKGAAETKGRRQRAGVAGRKAQQLALGLERFG